MSSADQDIIRQIEKTIQASRDGTYRPKTMQPSVDPYDLREQTKDTLKGRTADDENPQWRAVMEHYGFRWYPPHVLNKTIGPRRVIQSTHRAVIDPKELDEVVTVVDPATGRPKQVPVKLQPHEDGQWRREHPTREAFTPADLIALFSSTHAFDAWMGDRDTRARYRRAGLIA